MKKNIYIIMSEAEAPELEALLENAECDMPEGISAENITIKVLEKRKKAKARARALWLRFGAVAACLALIIASVPTAQYIFGATAQTTENNKIAFETELGFMTVPSIAYPDSLSYNYYLPLENGSVLCQEIVATEIDACAFAVGNEFHILYSCKVVLGNASFVCAKCRSKSCCEILIFKECALCHKCCITNI